MPRTWQVRVLEATNELHASGTTLIRVYEDPISIMNATVLPEGWSAATLLAPHASHAPNPAVADVFFRAGMIEAWGGGIALMRRRCAAHGSPEPELHYDSQTLRLEFPFAPEYVLRAGVAGRTPVEMSVETPVAMSVEMSGKRRGGIPDQVVALLANEPAMTLAEAAIRLGRTVRSIERATAALTKAARLRRVGSRKSGHWEVLG